ncbi:MAG: hypothetical protein AAGK98_03795 [Pseudomonadota bacterium]
MLEFVILDNGSLVDILRGGPSAIQALEAQTQRVLVTSTVIDELPSQFKPDFDNWVNSSNKFRYQKTPQVAAPGSQAGDASIRWTEEKYGILAAGDARLLSQERGLINWANKISESDRFDGAFLTPLGLYNESLYAHYITGDQYNDLVEGLYASGRIEHNYPKEYRSLALSPEEVRYWTELSPQLEAGLEASGFSVLGVK